MITFLINFIAWQPTICRNPVCANRKRFMLDTNKSRFVDFQKVRIQETQAELPRGSIPRRYVTFSSLIYLVILNSCDWLLYHQFYLWLHTWMYHSLWFCYCYSVEVILRAEAVELSQAGDKCDFTGTLIVVPDVAQLAMPGQSWVCLSHIF